jgi:hypothetical protein
MAAEAILTDGPELPPELWERILSECALVGPHKRLGELSVVCHLFQAICQRLLFREIHVKASTGSWLDWRPNMPYEIRSHHPTSRYRTGSAYESRKWRAWKADIRMAIKAERRIALIAQHPFLALQLQFLHINGYHNACPAEPLLRPFECAPASRASFDEQHQLRKTLSSQLAAFKNLRGLHLRYYAVDCELLRSLETHPTVTELTFDRCWFPDETHPLTSIMSLALLQLPGSHINSNLLSVDDPYRGVPDHQIISAFNLISPVQLERLEVKMGCTNTSAAFAFQQLCYSTSQRGPFLQLKQLLMTFDSGRDVPPNDLIRQFLSQTPRLRELEVHGRVGPWTTGAIPKKYIPSLEDLTCPLQWARFVVPGRPIRGVTLSTDTVPPHAMQRQPGSVDPSEDTLKAWLQPLTLSLAPLNRLHLPMYPPLAPVWVLIPYISTHFPHLLNFRSPIAGSHVGPRRQPTPYLSKDDGPMWRENEMIDYEASEEDVQALVNEIRDDVEASYSVSPPAQASSPSVESTLSRVMVSSKGPAKSITKQPKTYKSRLLALLTGPKQPSRVLEGRNGVKSYGYSKSSSSTMQPSQSTNPSGGSDHSTTPLVETLQQPTTPLPISSSDTVQGDPENLRISPNTRPLTLPTSITSVLSGYFGDVDAKSGIPQRKPYHASVSRILCLNPVHCTQTLTISFQHIIYFLIKGYYRLPESIQRLDLCACLSSAEGHDLSEPMTLEANRYHWTFDHLREPLIEALSELSWRYPALSSYTISCVRRNVGFRTCESFERINDKETVQGLKPQWAYSGVERDSC